MHPHPDEIEVGTLVDGANRDGADAARRPHHNAVPTIRHCPSFTRLEKQSLLNQNKL
jgi:hypothetical protein